MRNALVKYAGLDVLVFKEDLLRDLADILYDEMILNKILLKADLSESEANGMHEVFMVGISHGSPASDNAQEEEQEEEAVSCARYDRRLPENLHRLCQLELSSLCLTVAQRAIFFRYLCVLSDCTP